MTGRGHCRAVLLAAVGLILAGPARSQVRFPGPVPVETTGEALSAVSLPLEAGVPAFLVSGEDGGVLALHRYSTATQGFQLINRFLAGGRIVQLIPWQGRPVLHPGVVAATVNPDRILFIRVQSQPPYFTVEQTVVLEEDPGTMSFCGDPPGGISDLAVSLPGIDQVVFLRPEDGAWEVFSVQDTGDDPRSILGIDLDGDQVRELVTANRGPLSGTLGIFRRDQFGGYVGSQQDFAAGFPGSLASSDIDGDGLSELAATVVGSSGVILLRAEAGLPAAYDSVEVTLPADDLHMTSLFDGTTGLFTANRERGLVDFFQFDKGVWVRRDSYYPGCRPLALASGDFNGDGGRDLVSMGGDDNRMTVMFANSQPGFWGFPALTLEATPGSSGLADFDGDGLRDLVVANSDPPLISFFRGRPDGGLALSPLDFPLSFRPGPVAVLDTDGDDEPELAILDGAGGRVHVADYVPGQGFVVVSRTVTGAWPSFVSAADIDADGRADLMIITREESEVLLLYGAGDNSFPDRTVLGIVNSADWISTLDLDADGLPDLALSDGVNRVWTTLNLGDRTFAPMNWLNAGAGARIMAVGDLDQDLDEDLLVVNESDETLSMFENTGSGLLTRRIGAVILTSAPAGVVIRDMNADSRPEIVLNLRPEGMLGISYPLGSWEYSPATTFEGGPDVEDFNVADFNRDGVPDILTLDGFLKLGLTLLNVERELVAVRPGALTAECSPRFLELRIRPDRPGDWRVDFLSRGRRTTLAVSGRALLGRIDYDRETWILTVDRRDLGAPAAEGILRLTVGDGDQLETLDLALADPCPPAPEQDLPLVAWSRKPWPNPFNPLVNARFVLGRGAAVQAGVYDLNGRRVAVLADGWFEAGDHSLRWDGRSAGRPAAAGGYLLRISTPGRTLVHKIMLLK